MYGRAVQLFPWPPLPVLSVIGLTNLNAVLDTARTSPAEVRSRAAAEATAAVRNVSRIIITRSLHAARGESLRERGPGSLAFDAGHDRNTRSEPSGFHIANTCDLSRIVSLRARGQPRQLP